MTDLQQSSIDLDLRGTVCPMAFVRLRLFADAQKAGEAFSVLYEDSAANGPLRRSTEALGYQIVSEEDVELGGVSLKLMTVKKSS